MKKTDIGNFMGELISFRDGLKLYHWHVTGEGSYATHMAIDQAVESLNDPIDGLIETTYAILGDIDIVIPETRLPQNLIEYVQNFYKTVDNKRELFKEDFSDSILDDIAQALEQLLYRIKRLK